MALTSLHMSLSEYMHYSPPPGYRDELIEGELILSPSPNRRHADVCHNLTRLLERVVDPRIYVVRNDVTLILNWDEEHGNRPRPDVFVMDRRRWLASDETGGYPEGSPELTIEVLSPSNTMAEMDRKKTMYLGTGSIEFWLVDSTRKTIAVHSQNGEYAEYSVDLTIHLPRELGSGEISVAGVFAGLEA